MPLTTTNSLFIGLQMLRRNPMRTFLSALGVIIGVGSLMAILNLGDSLEQFSRDQIERTTDLQMIEVAPLTIDRVEGIVINRPNAVTFTPQDVEPLARYLGDESMVTLLAVGSQWLSVEGDTARYPSLVMATLPNAAAIFLKTVRTGGFLSGVSADPDEVVLSHRLAGKMSKGRDVSALQGTIVRMGDKPFRVVGVMGAEKQEETSSQAYISLASPFGQSLVHDGNKLPRLLVKVAKIENYDTTLAQVKHWLAERYGPVGKNFAISNVRQRHEQLKQAMLVFKLIMGCITGISLIVGGIGIMNVLLASVSERTREIGIRRAAGARKRDILLQFLVESISISGLGGLCGVILGYLVTVIAMAIIRSTTEASLQAATSVPSILIAFGASFVVGVLFGLYPAIRAAKLSPTDAIRYE
jgi:putative ABC transport system permease protein